MEKNIIGEWGADLSPVRYGRALATLGVLESSGSEQYPPSNDPQELLSALVNEFKQGAGTVVWRKAFINVINQSYWQETVHENAGALASAWELLIEKYIDQPRNRPRLAVSAAWRNRSDLFDLETLIRWLGNPKVGCQALNLVPDDISDEECRYLWHWPIRVGVPAGRSGELLMESLRAPDHYWVEELAQLQWVGEARDSCDLLILPPRMVAQLEEQPRLRLRASFIICMDEPVGSSQASDTPAAHLLKRTGAAGVAVVGHIRQKDVHSWYREIIQELSHDMPIHAAVWKVGVDMNVPPIIMGLPQVLDRLRILAIAERIDRKRELLQHYGYIMPLADFGIWTQSVAEYVSKSKFDSEENYGVPVAEKYSRIDGELDNTSQSRWIQANIWHDHSQVKPAQALEADRPSLVSCFIGPSAEKRVDGAFPDQAIDYKSGPVDIDLQIAIAGAAVAATPASQPFRDYIGQARIPFDQALGQLVQAPEAIGNQLPMVGLASKRISLPAVGSSQQAEFAVWPQPGVTEVSGRIALFHKNRLLQTARFTAPVGKEVEVMQGVVLEAEEFVHPLLEDLAERRDGDVALSVADDLGGHFSLIVQKNGKSIGPVYLDVMRTSIMFIRNILLETTRRTSDALDLQDNEEMRKLLFYLSYHGSILYQHLRKELGEELDNIERIQITSFGSTYFPLEYIYSGPPCDEDAIVCRNALQALASGVCVVCKDKGTSKSICPLSFWGLSKSIERHANSQIKPPSEEDRKHLPIPTRTSFGALTPVVFAASEKAFLFTDRKTWEGRLIGLMGRLEAGQSARIAQDWPEWRSLVTGTVPGPKLLVLLPHAVTDSFGIEVLEIGQGSRLLKTKIADDKYLVGAIEIPQLLLLLGCGTAQVDSNFAPYPELFHDAGADIIIAPLAPILGADALPIAYRISELLAEHAQRREIALGDLMRQIRRELLGEGYLSVLGLLSFGDADWIFGG